VLHLDGTFKSAPKFFHEIFTIHGLSHATSISLLANKHQKSYEDIFRHTVSVDAKLGVNVFSKNIYADFETTTHNAVKTVWTGREVKECLIHLGQYWRQKIQSLGLSIQYEKKDSEISQFLKKLFGLSFSPPAEISDSLALEFISNLPNDKRVEQFCNYLLENYIDVDSTFPMPVWSEYRSSSLRTINVCESFHVHFSAIFLQCAP
jgi:hypothetical protein